LLLIEHNSLDLY